MVTEFIMHKTENMQLHSEVLKARDHLDDLSGDGRINFVSISGLGGGGGGGFVWGEKKGVFLLGKRY